MKRIVNRYKLLLPLLLLVIAVTCSYGINTASAVPSQIYVSNTGSDAWNGQAPTWNGVDGPKQTIKNAANTVTTGGTVHIQNGTYNENDISVFSKNVNFVGESKTKTIVNGNQISRIFSVGAQGVTYSFSFTNMTFMNGKSSAGGAVWNYGATTFENCIFKNNNATFSGGAIYSQGTGSAPAALTLTNCIFNNNTCNNGILLNALSTLSVNGCDFYNNTGTTQSILWNNFGSISNFQFNRIIGTGKLISSDSGGDLSLNWWGSNADPTAKVTGVTVTPWLVLTSSSNPTSVGNGGKSTITASLLYDSGILTDPTHPDLYYHDPAFGHVPDGILVSFLSDLLGSVSPVTNTTVNGAATTKFTAGATTGLSTITSTIDTQASTATVNIVTPPAVTNTDPAYNAVNVAVNKVIKITFNRAIQFGTNPWFEFKTSTGTSVPFTTSILGNVLTITPNTLLALGTKYSVILHSGSIMDMAGIAMPTPFSTVFTTTSTAPTAPVVTSTDPKNNSVNIPVSKVVKFTFNKAIKLATNPWIEFKTSTGTTKSFVASVSGSTLSLTPTTALALGTSYLVILHSNSVYDSTGLSGLASPYTLSFKTA